MGETVPLFSTSFNQSIRVESRPEHLTADAGALVARETLDRLGIVEWLDERLVDGRKPGLVVHPQADLLRTCLILLGQGRRDHDDADRLREDPALRLAKDGRRGTAPLAAGEGLASQPTLSRLAAALSGEGNRRVLREAVAELAVRRLLRENGGRRIKRLAVDVDGLPVEVRGRQPGSGWNGYCRRNVYHPLVASCGERGDLLDGVLRRGAAGAAEGALEFALDLVDRLRGRVCESLLLRMDAGFPDGKTLAGLEARGVDYVARVRNNAALDRMAEPLMRRPPGRPPGEPRFWCHEMRYRARGWNRERRVVLVVVERPGELLLDRFWLITNLPRRRRGGPRLLALYRKRGKAEGHMGELMDALAPSLSSSPRPKSHYRGRRIERAEAAPAGEGADVPWAANEALFLLNLLACGTMHAGRRLMERATGRGWSLRRYRERVLRVAARAVVHARRVTFSVARSAAADWALLWRRLGDLNWDTGWNRLSQSVPRSGEPDPKRSGRCRRAVRRRGAAGPPREGRTADDFPTRQPVFSKVTIHPPDSNPNRRLPSAHSG